MFPGLSNDDRGRGERRISFKSLPSSHALLRSPPPPLRTHSGAYLCARPDQAQPIFSLVWAAAPEKKVPLCPSRDRERPGWESESFSKNKTEKWLFFPLEALLGCSFICISIHFVPAALTNASQSIHSGCTDVIQVWSVYTRSSPALDPGWALPIWGQCAFGANWFQSEL